MHHTPLISMLVAGLGLAFVFGMLATRLKISPLVGYLLAGVAIGPFTPGFVGDMDLAAELAEIGVILLMFGVGLHFSLRDLLSVRRLAIPGAVAQIGIATALGAGLAHLMGWGLEEGIVFGLALSVASTVVLLRALQERRVVETERGRIAVGWLIVEDIAMILALVLLPAWAGIKAEATGGVGVGQLQDIGWALAITIAKVAAFAAVMLIVGRKVVPWVLHRVVHTGNREMFRLAVLAIALGCAFGASSLFGVSFALGAFFAGMIMSESELSHQAANESLPLRDAFAVLFFVSVGMLFDPRILIENPWPLLAVLAIIVVGKSLAALAIMHLFRQPLRWGLLIAASLAQIGEFSFILASLGVSLGLISDEARDLILGGAILSIMLNPLVFVIADRMKQRTDPAVTPAPAPEPEPSRAIVVGYGRTGSRVGGALIEAGVPFTVIEDSQQIVDSLAAEGRPVVAGNAASGEALKDAGAASARWLFVTVADGFEAGAIVEEARRANPDLVIVARAHSEAEAERLRHFGSDAVISGEAEIARAMVASAGPLGVGAKAARPKPRAPDRPPALILDDAERAMLEGLRETGVGPLEAVSVDRPMQLASERHGFDLDRLEEALVELKAKHLVVEAGDNRVRLTGAGFLKAAGK